MEFSKKVSISNKYDLLKHCEIRSDCIYMVEKLDQYDIIKNILKYFDELGFDCDDIYEFFIFDVDDFIYLVKLLNSEDFLSDEKLQEILENEGGEN